MVGVEFFLVNRSWFIPFAVHIHLRIAITWLLSLVSPACRQIPASLETVNRRVYLHLNWLFLKGNRHCDFNASIYV